SNTCDVCRGNGIIIEERITSGGVFQRQISCKKCGASGIYIKPSDRCGQCQGSGYINKEENETITIEKGEKDEKVYTFERKGHSSKEDKDLVGDLYVVLSVQSDRAFEKMDDDLLIDIKIDYIEALCGFKRVIKLLDGELVNIQQTINDPPIKPNSVMRIPNLGMPKKNGNGSGNLFLKFEVVFPDEPILKNPSEDSLKNFKGLLKQMNKNNILYDSGNKNIINPDKSQESKRNEKMIFDKKMTEHIFRPAFKNSNSKSQRGNHYTSAPSDDEEDGDQTQQQQYYQSRGGGQSTQCQVA
ncbi:MAG: Type I HSP40 co-chaperone, partial [Paramarteilia canceri]